MIPGPVFWAYLTNYHGMVFTQYFNSVKPINHMRQKMPSVAAIVRYHNAVGNPPPLTLRGPSSPNPNAVCRHHMKAPWHHYVGRAGINDAPCSAAVIRPQKNHEAVIDCPSNWSGKNRLGNRHLSLDLVRPVFISDGQIYQRLTCARKRCLTIGAMRHPTIQIPARANNNKANNQQRSRYWY